MRATRASQPVTAFSFVGNLGCVRFPPSIRKASGVKRGDRLTVSVQSEHAILLEKVPTALTSDALEVEGCACAAVPEGCGGSQTDLVTVGWSYVQLGTALATQLGFLPGRPLKLRGEPSQIAISIHRRRRDLEGVPKVACPP